MATWCKELTHLKRPWCWERLRAGGEGDDRGWDGWMASPTQWTWVWVNSRNWCWTGRPGVLLFMGSQRVRHYWANELNWTHKKHGHCLEGGGVPRESQVKFPSVCPRTTGDKRGEKVSSQTSFMPSGHTSWESLSQMLDSSFWWTYSWTLS